MYNLVHGPNIPGAYAIVFFIALDFTFFTRHIHNWMSFLPWSVSSFFLDLLVIPLHSYSSSILDTFWPAHLLLLSHFSRVWLCATPQTAAHQASPSMGFSRWEYWSGLPLLSLPAHLVVSYLFAFSYCSCVLQARILEYVAVSSSRDHFVRTLHYDPSIFGGPAWYGS